MNVIPHPKLLHIVRGRILARAKHCDERTRQRAVSIGIQTLRRQPHRLGRAITEGTDYLRRCGRVTHWDGGAA
jgi:hypothetical protein